MYNYGTLTSNAGAEAETNQTTVQPAKAAKRQQWGNHVEFILSCLGYAVGLGNVWRFPYLCYKNGGGAFFIPYFISLFVIGIPLFLAEVAIGQFARASPLACWNFSPLFRGVGASMLCISALIGLYYNVIVSWSLLYFCYSIGYELPWTRCGDWASLRCRDDEHAKMMNISDCVDGKKPDREVCIDTETNKAIGYFYENYTNVLPAEDYLKRYALQGDLSPGIHDIGTPKWDVTLCLLLTWILIGLTISQGIKTSGKIIYFTALFPYAVLLVLFINGVMLEGAANGLKFYLTPDLSTLASGTVWRDALVQIFFSLGVGWGCLMALSSYNDFNDHVVHDSLIVSLGNCGTSIFAGFVIFSYLGHFAYRNNQSVHKVAKSGVTLAFAVYPQALSLLRGSVFFSLCFFSMLFMLGFNTEFAVIDTLVATVCEVAHLPSKLRPIVLATICSVYFLLAISMTTPGGEYVVALMDDYSASWNTMVISLLLCLAITISGPKLFTEDIRCMMGNTVFRCIPWSIARWYFIACWTVIAPILLIFIMIFTFATYKYPVYGMPLAWPVAVGRLLTGSVLLVGAVVMAHDILKTPGPFPQRIRTLVSRSKTWVPLVKEGAVQKQSFEVPTPQSTPGTATPDTSTPGTSGQAPSTPELGSPNQP